MTPLVALAFVRAHWRGFGGAALAVAIFFAGRRSVTCPSCAPAVAAKMDDHAARTTEATKDTEREAGPTRKVVLEFDPHCPPSAPVRIVPGQPLPPSILRETVIETGPVQTITRAATETQATEDHHLELHVSPAPSVVLPRFSLFWEPRIRPDMGLGIVGGGVRLTESVWLDGWAEPSVRAVGAGIRFTF